MRNSLMSEIEKFFRPEFINRLDEVIVFRPLDRENLTSIIEFELSKVRERLAAKRMTLELDAAAKDFLIDKGYNPDFGARPLRRALSSYIEDPLAENLLSGEFLEGDSIKVTRNEEEDHLSFEATRGSDDEDGGDDDSPESETDSANAASA
jgi:ATP-dependent Clp protease ATP-binding subunit ClpC